MLRFLFLLVLLLAAPVQAQDAPAQTLSPALNDHLLALETATSRLRGLERLREVTRSFPTRAEVVDYFSRVYAEELDEDTARRETAFYVAFDLIPAGTDLRGVYLDFLTSPAGVGGFYDTETETMNVLLLGGGALPDERLPLLEQTIYVHEFTHALQDQHFDLERLLAGIEEPDHVLATLALVEGDAQIITGAYLQRAISGSTMAMLSVILQAAQVGAFNTPSGLPPFILTESLFPYEQGQIFVTELYRAGGWDAINAAYANPPISTEQVLHPDKYLAGEQPQPVTLETALPDGWARLIDRPLGEFYLRAWLNTQLSRADASRAAAGWGGDRLHLYQSADGQNAWALRLVWDTPADADEFAAALAQYGAARFGAAAAADGCWESAQAALCFTAADSTLAQAPTRALALALRG
jgi:hypothetical protein